MLKAMVSPPFIARPPMLVACGVVIVMAKLQRSHSVMTNIGRKTRMRMAAPFVHNHSHQSIVVIIVANADRLFVTNARVELCHYLIMVMSSLFVFAINVMYQPSLTTSLKMVN